MKIQCPAKINLDLKIVRKREDGFHDIESVMQTINLYDYLTLNVTPSENFQINLEGTSSEIPYDKKNIVYKAIELFCEFAAIPPHKIDVFIEKNIPISAGLAGGSSDAAGILKGLNEIFNNPIPNTELHKLCAKLGSDLNFCLEGGRQLAKGRGEILLPLKFEDFSVSLIKPLKLGISAKEAYSKFAEKKSLNLSGRDNFKNDLEWAVIEDYPELKNIKNLYPNSVMTGSGSTFFLLGDTFRFDEGYWVKNNLKACQDGILIIKE